MILGLCDRFHCLPEKGGLLDQDASLIRMVRIQALGTRQPREEEMLDELG